MVAYSHTHLLLTVSSKWTEVMFNTSDDITKLTDRYLSTKNLEIISKLKSCCCCELDLVAENWNPLTNTNTNVDVFTPSYVSAWVLLYTIFAFIAPGASDFMLRHREGYGGRPRAKWRHCSSTSLPFSESFGQ